MSPQTTPLTIRRVVGEERAYRGGRYGRGSGTISDSRSGSGGTGNRRIMWVECSMRLASGLSAVYCMDYYPKNKYPDSALSAEKTRQRFARLDSHVRMRTGIRGGLDWIRVTRDRSPTRESSKQDDTTWNLFFDAEKIRGRRIVLVDDITTRGMSFVQCARKLMNFGAVEVVGFFFGKSVR